MAQEPSVGRRQHAVWAFTRSAESRDFSAYSLIVACEVSYEAERGPGSRRAVPAPG